MCCLALEERMIELKDKNVYLHVGLCKSGTTSIQNTLQYMQDSGILAKENFQYHCRDKLFLAHMMQMCFPEDEKIFLSKLHEVIASNSKVPGEVLDNLILSQEIFSMDLVDNMFELSSVYARYFYNALQGCNVKIIVYLRRQDIFIESMYSELLKTGMITREKFEKKEMQKSLYYKKFLDGYAEYFGKENIVIRIFERDLLHKNDVVRDFLQVVGLDDIYPHKLRQEQMNYSLPPEALRIRMAFDGVYRLSANERDNYIQKLEDDYLAGKIAGPLYAWKKIYTLHGRNFDLSQKYSKLQELFYLEKKGSFSNSGFMQPDERREFLSQYEEDNAKVAREYLGREDGKLFNDKFPENIISLDEPSTTDIVTIFLPIIQQLHERTQKIEVCEARIEGIDRRLGYFKRPWKIIPIIARKIVNKFRKQ